LVFEFSNDEGFYDIFKDNKLLTAVAGKQALADLDVIRKTLVKKTMLKNYFGGQNIFLSMHPSPVSGVDILLTVAAKKDFTLSKFNEVAAKKGELLITPFRLSGKPGYTVFVKSLNKRFFIIAKGHNIFSGSFSKELVEQSAKYKAKDKQEFTLLPAQQNSNALANLYINYPQAQVLLSRLFKNETGLFGNLKKLPATAVLSLNYKSDALMFNGTTTLNNNMPASYINLFVNQQPVQNQLKNIFPSTTAYVSGFAVSNPARFTADLALWQQKTGIDKKRKALLSQIENETGVDIKTEFNTSLKNEFAVVTTRFDEKLAIITIKNGSALTPVLMNISESVSENRGRFKYDRLPSYLLGEAFSIFRKPYFMIIDNYLILANSSKEIDSYYESYIDHKFLSKMEQYNNFDDLMSQRSNVCAFVLFKNARLLFKRDLFDDIYTNFENEASGWNDIYAASYQLTATDKSYYTNLCIGLNTDSVKTVPGSAK
ncbi:MAG: hypothetical protein ABIN95_00130, partial [Mucilaginibacter sp.]